MNIERQEKKCSRKQWDKYTMGEGKGREGLERQTGSELK